MKLVPFLFLPLLASPLSSQNVHVVDAAGAAGSDFLDLGSAVSAAVDGDVILVRAGSYPEVLAISGKSVVVQAASSFGARPVLDGVEVDSLTAGQSVVVRGLALENLGPVNLPHGIDVHDNVGPVWIEDVEVSSSSTVLFTEGPSMQVQNCDSVVLSRVTSVGAFGTTTSVPGLVVIDSRVDVFDSNIDATSIFFGVDLNPPAIQIEGASHLGLSQVVAHGGPGTLFFDSHGVCNSSPGGPAVRLTGSPDLVVQASTLEGGVDPCDNTSTAPYDLAGGTLLELDSPARSHRASSPVRDDESVQVILEGEPGDLFFALFSTSPRAPIDALAFDLPLLLQLPLGQANLGTIPPSGVRTLFAPIGDLGAGVEARVVYTQAFTITPGVGQASLTEPSAVTLLDAGF